MKYTVLCEFFQRDNVPAIEVIVTAIGMKQAKINARIECIKRGLPIPKHITFIKLRQK